MVHHSRKPQNLEAVQSMVLNVYVVLTWHWEPVGLLPVFSIQWNHKRNWFWCCWRNAIATREMDIPVRVRTSRQQASLLVLSRKYLPSEGESSISDNPDEENPPQKCSRGLCFRWLQVQSGWQTCLAIIHRFDNTIPDCCQLKHYGIKREENASSSESSLDSCLKHHPIGSHFKTSYLRFAQPQLSFVHCVLGLTCYSLIIDQYAVISCYYQSFVITWHCSLLEHRHWKASYVNLKCSVITQTSLSPDNKNKR